MLPVSLISLVSNSISPSSLDPIYSEEFSYSLPRSILTSYIEGKAFDHKESYTEEELTSLVHDINTVYDSILEKDPLKKPIITMTAGAPGAGKTTLMRSDLQKQSTLLGREIAYIDPDDVGLKGMRCSYQLELQLQLEVCKMLEYGSEEEVLADQRKVRQEMYNKWRPGSNGLNHLILAHLICQGYAVHFGTTSTSPQSATFFEFLKKHGYSIRLLHVTASDEVRWRSIVERDKQFVQTTEEDTRVKGKLFPQRLPDYFRYADEIEFYYREAFDKEAVLAAKWTKTDVEVLDAGAFEKVQTVHNEICNQLEENDLKGKSKDDFHWENVFNSALTK